MWRAGLSVHQGHELRPSGEVLFKPVQRGMKKDMVVNSVKAEERSRRMRREVQPVSEVCLGAVEWTETGLEFFVQTV